MALSNSNDRGYYGTHKRYFEFHTLRKGHRWIGDGHRNRTEMVGSHMQRCVLCDTLFRVFHYRWTKYSKIRFCCFEHAREFRYHGGLVHEYRGLVREHGELV